MISKNILISAVLAAIVYMFIGYTAGFDSTYLSMHGNSMNYALYSAAITFMTAIFLIQIQKLMTE